MNKRGHPGHALMPTTNILWYLSKMSTFTEGVREVATPYEAFINQPLDEGRKSFWERKALFDCSRCRI